MYGYVDLQCYLILFRGTNQRDLRAGRFVRWRGDNANENDGLVTQCILFFCHMDRIQSLVNGQKDTQHISRQIQSLTCSSGSCTLQPPSHPTNSVPRMGHLWVIPTMGPSPCM